jgi:hypothetical protein
MLGIAGGGSVDLDRLVSGEGFVGSDVVEDLPVGVGFGGEGGQVVDLEPVEVFVFQRAEGAFADAVLAG